MMQQWTTIIKPKAGLFEIPFRELAQYKELVWMFVKRNFSTQYKQTILGPAWLIITPLINTLISTFVFGSIAQISSGTVPYFLFYMAANTIWSYFAKCMNTTSSTFTGNVDIFSKVYFPRMTLPISTVIFNLFNFFIQLIMFLCFMLYFWLTGAAICPNIWLLYVPVLILQTALLGLGFGIIVSALTTKYRDLTVLVGFGIQLWMYITPIIYTSGSIENNLYKIAYYINPMAPVVETFRYAFLGAGTGDPVPNALSLGISGAITVAVFFLGLILFNRVEKTFMDTV